MKISLTSTLLIVTLNVFSQSWTFQVTTSEFDGKIRSTSCVGHGNEIPYTSPSLTVNYFESNGEINFYLKGGGYTGCDYNKITLVFDGKRKFQTVEVSDNANRDAIFLNNFSNFEVENLLPMEIIFDQMIKSQKLSIRFENDCFQRDFYFTLNGFKQNLLKVLSDVNIEKRISLKLKMLSYNDSITKVINSIANNEIEFYKNEIDKYPLFFNNTDNPHKISINDLTKIIAILNSLKQGYENNESYLKSSNEIPSETNRVIFKISNINEIIAVNTRTYSPDTFHTGYFIKIKEDSLKLMLTPSQNHIEKVIDAYKGDYHYSIQRLLRRIVNEDFYQNNIPENVLNELAKAMNNRAVYKIRIVRKDLDKGMFEMKYNVKHTSWLFFLYNTTFPYKFILSEEEILIAKSIERQKRIVQDSIINWSNIPDSSKAPLQYYQVTIHPTTQECQGEGIIESTKCIESYVEEYLKRKLDQNRIKSFTLLILVDGYGNIFIDSVRGLNIKQENLIKNNLRGIPPIIPARNGLKWNKHNQVVSVIVPLQIDL